MSVRNGVRGFREVARAEQIREELARWRLHFGVWSITTVSLFAWVMQQMDSGWGWLEYGAAGLTVYLGLVLIAIDHKMKQQASQLGELECSG